MERDDEDREEAPVGSTEGVEEESREKEEEGLEGEERVEAEVTSEDRLDTAGNPDHPSPGTPYPPKPG